MLKYFPELGKKAEVSLDDVLNKCEPGKKAMENIKAFEHQLRINKKLMDLKDPNIPDEAKEEIKNVLLQPNKAFKSQEFVDLYNEDELGNSIPNLQMWLFNNFNELQKYK